VRGEREHNLDTDISEKKKPPWRRGPSDDGGAGTTRCCPSAATTKQRGGSGVGLVTDNPDRDSSGPASTTVGALPRLRVGD